MTAPNDLFEKRMVALEHEQSVLGALLRLNRSIDQLNNLREEDFYDGQHRLIYRALVQMIAANKPADVVTVFGYLQAQGKNVEMSYLNAMAQSMPSAANIAHYAGIVRDRAQKRGLLVAADEITQLVYQSPDDAPTIVDAAQAKLEALGRVNMAGEPEHAIESLSHHLIRLDEEYNGSESPAISTGFTDLDVALNGGPRRGNLWVLAARPKMGKTALALNIANHVAVGGVAAVLSMEMSKGELNNRNIASIGRIDLNHLNSPKMLTTDDWNSVTTVAGKIANMGLYLDDQGGLTLLQVRSKAMQIKRKAGRLDMLVIDYLQLMTGPGDNRNAQIEAITRGLKALAKELDCVILLLSQLNRQLEQRPNKRPQPSDLRDSGSIEQDADLASFLYRDEVYHPDSQDKGIAELNIALNRQGASGRINLVYLGQYTRFEDVARGWHPAPPKAAPTPRRGFDD